MANLRVDKITSTETFETTGSVQFDGTTDFLTISSNTGFAMGTGDFTAECWIYLRGYSDAEGGYSERVFDSNTGQLGIYITSDGTGYVGALVGGTDIRSSTAPDLQSWSHLAISRSGTAFRIFLNGTQILSRENSSSVASSGNFLIGARASGEGGFRGHISNFRILKGKALYTTNFTPPTRELTVTPETVLLACQHKTDASHEKTGKTITVNGNAVANELTPGLLTDVVKSGGNSAITGSVEFDGTGDYLSVTPTDNFTFGTNSFTIEMFVYKGSRTDTHILYDHRNTTGAQGLHPTLYYSGSNLHYYVNGSNIITTSNYTQNTWQHYALVRSTSTNTVKLYINGIQVASASDTNDYVAPQSGAPYIGQNPGGSFYFDGFISNLRIVKGTALYTSNFIPPTRELKKVPGTVLLCCQDSKNPLTESTGKTISLNGSGTSYSVGIGTTTPNPSNFTPQVGNDGSVEFVGPTKINTENYFYLPTGDTESRFPNFASVDGGSRGLFAGNNLEPASGNTIDYITISSTGNSQDFGDRIGLGRRQIGAVASPTRAVFAGSYSPLSNIIDYVTISSTGNAQDFGDCTTNLTESTGISNSTRGIFAGGRNPTVHNVIQYVTMSSMGNAIDFGDMLDARRNCGSFQSPTRGVIVGGRDGSGTSINSGYVGQRHIEYVIISTTANALDFGDISSGGGQSNMGGSNSTRGIIAGGSPSTNTITYVTIASTGNSIEFGDNTAATDGMNTMATSPTRACMYGGNVPARTISYVTIASTGNAIDFGSLTGSTGSYYDSGCSNGHGGLG